MNFLFFSFFGLSAGERPRDAAGTPAPVSGTLFNSSTVLNTDIYASAGIYVDDGLPDFIKLKPTLGGAL